MVVKAGYEAYRRSAESTSRDQTVPAESLLKPHHGTSKNEIERQIKPYVDEKLRMTTSSKNNNKLRTFQMWTRYFYARE